MERHFGAVLRLRTLFLPRGCQLVLHAIGSYGSNECLPSDGLGQLTDNATFQAIRRSGLVGRRDRSLPTSRLELNELILHFPRVNCPASALKHRFRWRSKSSASAPLSSQQMFQGNKLSSTLKVCAAVDRLIIDGRRLSLAHNMSGVFSK